MNTNIVIHTNLGEIRAELYQDKAPKTVLNFLDYVSKDFYKETIFHRVISGFMIQTGGYKPDGTRNAQGNPIENESANGLKNERGTLAMARRIEAHSATASFFINVDHEESLDYKGPDEFGYCVFGKVIEGLDVVDKISDVETDSENKPSEEIIILNISVEDNSTILYKENI